MKQKVTNQHTHPSQFGSVGFRLDEVYSQSTAHESDRGVGKKIWPAGCVRFNTRLLEEVGRSEHRAFIRASTDLDSRPEHKVQKRNHAWRGWIQLAPVCVRIREALLDYLQPLLYFIIVVITLASLGNHGDSEVCSSAAGGRVGAGLQRAGDSALRGRKRRRDVDGGELAGTTPTPTPQNKKTTKKGRGREK